MNPNAITDIYLYDIPIAERHNLCKILLIQNVWEILAEQMGYDSIEVNELKSIKYETKYKEAEELLARWGEQNHTITELFVLLSRMQQYAAMNAIKNLVDSRYHRLIGDVHVIKASTSKPKISEKILNGSATSDENNESKPNLNDKQGHDNKFDINECASAIAQIGYEVLRNATNNWSDENVLGKGGFGTVFKGVWAASTAVAIKRIENRPKNSSEPNKIRIRQSLNELRYWNSCRHPHILPLYGFSVNESEHELYLVCQLMEGGSLDQRLFKRSSNFIPLTWEQRIKIARGTASGLLFLHTFQKKPIIHRDIKPGNILLDHSNKAKIGDFGFVREGDDNGITVSRTYGTTHYISPEYSAERKLTTKVDSYSFGIVLFELSTGLRVYDRVLKSYLIDKIKSYVLEGKLLELIDETAGEMEDLENIFEKIINLGRDCTKYNYEERPDMVKVLKFLEEIPIREKNS